MLMSSSFHLATVSSRDKIAKGLMRVDAAPIQWCRARLITRGIMHKGMHFKTRLFIVFQHEAI